MRDSHRDPCPNWQEEASRRLAKSKLSTAEREEISRELAGYLEDLYSDAPARGLDEFAAQQTAAAELCEDKHLGAHLFRARKENTMHLNDRVKHFWLPGMAMLFASVTCFIVLQIAGFQTHFMPLWLRGGAATPNSVYLPLAIYWPWLCVLPFLGAAGVYWSRRAGGGPAAQAAAGFFSVFAFLATFLTLFAFLLFKYLVGDVAATKTLFPEFAGSVLSWVVIPGVALLIGIVPFWRNRERQGA